MTEAAVPGGSPVRLSGFRSLFLSLLTAVVLAVPAARAGTVAGNTEGDLTVDGSGNAVYTVPVDVPPGVAGIEPILSFNYNSQAGNGHLGVGWSLGGLSVIHRCAKTIAQDGVAGGVNLNAEDRFCLDGQRLIAVSGLYGANGTEYRTEIDGFSRIVSHGRAGSGPQSFTVETKLGRILSYGNTADSRLEADGSATVRLWAIDEVADRLGNTMVFRYDDNTANKTFRISRIDYGYNDQANTRLTNDVLFVYETRPDPRSSYQAGSLLNTNARLKLVRTRANGAVVHLYNLTYQESPETSRSRLATITKCDGQNNCQAPLRFGARSGGTADLGGEARWENTPGDLLYWKSAFHDVNNDGLVDHLRWRHTRDSSGVKVSLNFGSGFRTAKTWEQLGSGWLGFQSAFHDVNGDGLVDHLRWDRRRDATVWVSLGDGQRFGTARNWEPNAFDWSLWFSEFYDVNGDALVDHVRYRHTGESSEVWVSLNTAGNRFARATRWERVAGEWRNWRSVFQDANGDGLVDHIRWRNGTSREVVVSLNSGSGFGAATTWDAIGADRLRGISAFADVNGDGLIDHLRWHNDRQGRDLWVSLGDGTRFGTARKEPYNRRLSSWNTEFLDVNGDALVDLVRWTNSGNQPMVWMSRNTGNGFAEAELWGGPSGPDWYYWGSQFLDLDGDGLADHVRYSNNIQAGLVSAWLNTGKVPDLVDSFTDSLGHVTQLGYLRTFARGANATFPVKDMAAPHHVVGSIAREDGAGGRFSVAYDYEGAKFHLHGRGFLGFSRVTATNRRMNVRTITEYRQDFPFVGAVAASETRLVGTNAKAQSDSYVWRKISLNGGRTVFPYALSTAAETFEINHGAGNRPVTRSITTTNYDTFGNPTRINVATSGGGETFTETTTNTYGNDTAKWLLGRLTRSEVKKTLPDLSSETRVTSFSYDPATGLLLREAIEPDLPADKLVTDYGYDAFGNVTSTTVSGADIATRTTSAGFSADGRFATSGRNELGHGETLSYDARFGAVTSLTGPNGITTTWDYDGFGRKTRERRADGTETTWSYDPCVSQCPAGAVYAVGQQDLNTASQTPIGPRSVAYFDRLERGFRSETEGFDGTKVFTHSEFDNRGRTVAFTRPYFEGTAASAIRKVRTTYDDLGRPLTVTQPDGGVTTTSYDGLTRTSTNALGQSETRRVDAIGRLVEAIDNLGTVVTYVHDPFGNLLETGAGGVVTTMAYDIRGRKTSMNDPDVGIWFYEHNALGELVRQTDPKGQSVDLSYDLLGRMLRRVEPEGITEWSYDSAAKGIGKLHSVTAPGGYLQAQSYDSLGRPSSTTTTIDGVNYTSGVTYDSSGRVATQSYPSGFTVRNAYNARGHLTSVSEDGGTTVFWRAESVNAEGQVTRESFGNGVETLSAYDSRTGLIDSIATRRGATVIQNLDYDFDKLGNLKRRADLRQGRAETSIYDGLNRLTATTLTATGAGTLAITSYSYDRLGNIETKSDVGSYSYGGGGAGPHAVTAAGGESYAYDANGNMISGAGRSIAWSSFNKPTLIRETATGNEADFTYGPDRARIKQHSVRNSLARDVVYLGAYERRMQFGSPDELVHYISAGGTVAIHTIHDDGLGATNKTRYLHRDHLGSVDTITGQSGAVIERLSFDAHGKRRLANWTAGDPVSPDAETPRGFTGHEHLDTVGLIHMNGRVYDPSLGRFLSADPYVQAPESSQSFNRYSYAGNNPLSYTDPSGFFFKKIAKAFKKVVKKVFKGVRKIVSTVLRGIRRVFKNRWVQMAGQVVAGVFLGPVGVAAYSAATTLANGGSLMDALTAAGLSYASSFAFNGVGELFNKLPAGFNPVAATLLRSVSYGTVGGALSVARGGTFRDGFASSGVLQAAAPMIGRAPGPIGNAVASAIAAGAAAHLGGGKFKNGVAGFAFQGLVRAGAQAAMAPKRVGIVTIEEQGVDGPSYEEIVAARRSKAVCTLHCNDDFLRNVYTGESFFATPGDLDWAEYRRSLEALTYSVGNVALQAGGAVATFYGAGALLRGAGVSTRSAQAFCAGVALLACLQKGAGKAIDSPWRHVVNQQQIPGRGGVIPPPAPYAGAPPR